MQICHVVPLKNILLYRETTNAIFHVFHSSFQRAIASTKRSIAFEESFRTITSPQQSSMYAVLLSTTPPFVWNICKVNNIKEFGIDVILYQYLLMSYLPHITTLRLIWIALSYRRNRRSAQRSRMSVVLLSSTRQFHRKIAEQ